MTKIIDEFMRISKVRKNKIGVGLLHDYPQIIASLQKVKKHIDITIVGPKKIPGFNCIKADNPDALVKLAKDNKVDAIFRGNFDAVALYDSLHKFFNFSGPLLSVSPLIIKKVNSLNDNLNAMISIIPWSPSNDGTVAKRMQIIDANIKFFESFGVKPKLGFLSAGKPSDILEGIAEIDKTLTEAEFLVNYYARKGYQCKHFNHQVELAVLESEIIVYPNAIVGNHGLRAIMFFGDSIYLGAISTNLPIIYSHIPEAFRDWENSLMFLNGYLNKDLYKIKK